MDDVTNDGVGAKRMLARAARHARIEAKEARDSIDRYTEALIQEYDELRLALDDERRALDEMASRLGVARDEW